ncbi:uncharacterized protein LOC129767115 [Toxorhynchites rutilus septentrionalis]|uniref:uncharacterized protein LOC129767115 n=1 Tax=Toxorhynchites rutilus septentrionalis TaxID=329112 RepID=UPI00247A8A11|nr:uncharacterized protein LOC129767115 [Toxorhynchites rutilus septentrionalis]
MPTQTERSSSSMSERKSMERQVCAIALRALSPIGFLVASHSRFAIQREQSGFFAARDSVFVSLDDSVKEKETKRHNSFWVRLICNSKQTVAFAMARKKGTTKTKSNGRKAASETKQTDKKDAKIKGE